MAEVQHTTVFDTGLQHLGSVYAKALLGAAENAGESEQVVAELRSLVDDVLTQLPRLEAMLASPRVPLETKERLLDRAFAERMSGMLLKFLKILCRRGRFECLRAIAAAARQLLNEMRGRVEVRVASASPLDGELRELTENQLRGALNLEVDVEWAVDTELIGGLVIRIGDTVYDGSLANRLARIRSDVVTKTTQQIRRDTGRFAVAD